MLEKLAMTVFYVCDGDINHNIRNHYTVEDMTNAHEIAKYIRWFQS